MRCIDTHQFLRGEGYLHFIFRQHQLLLVVPILSFGDGHCFQFKIRALQRRRGRGVVVMSLFVRSGQGLVVNIRRL